MKSVLDPDSDEEPLPAPVVSPPPKPKSAILAHLSELSERKKAAERDAAALKPKGGRKRRLTAKQADKLADQIEARLSKFSALDEVEDEKTLAAKRELADMERRIEELKRLSSATPQTARAGTVDDDSDVDLDELLAAINRDIDDYFVYILTNMLAYVYFGCLYKYVLYGHHICCTLSRKDTGTICERSTSYHVNYRFITTLPAYRHQHPHQHRPQRTHCPRQHQHQCEPRPQPQPRSLQRDLPRHL
jgi:hypothetical protein